MHEPGALLRPIVSFINSPLYNLSKFFTKILSPLAGRNGRTVKNSYEFVHTTTRLKLDDDECIMFFDVISLFTKISVDVAKSVIFELLSKDDCLQDRTKLCLKELMLGINMCLNNTYIQFKNQFYKQNFGVPMGSPIFIKRGFMQSCLVSKVVSVSNLRFLLNCFALVCSLFIIL